MPTQTPQLTKSILTDERAVCIFCLKEVVNDYNVHCGEAGAILTRAEYISYLGEDYFGQ